MKRRLANGWLVDLRCTFIIGVGRYAGDVDVVVVVVDDNISQTRKPPLRPMHVNEHATRTHSLLIRPHVRVSSHARTTAVAVDSIMRVRTTTATAATTTPPATSTSTTSYDGGSRVIPVAYNSPAARVNSSSRRRIHNLPQYGDRTDERWQRC